VCSVSSTVLLYNTENWNFDDFKFLTKIFLQAYGRNYGQCLAHKKISKTKLKFKGDKAHKYSITEYNLETFNYYIV
jgi:hypothetical protein